MTALHFLAATTWCGLLGAALPSPAPCEEAPWREPGQAVEAAYLRDGALRYAAEGRAIVGRNKSCFNNRPLYCEQPGAEGVVLAGDRPFLSLCATPFGCGGFSAAIVRDQTGKWFHEYADVEARYRCGRMTWRLADSRLPGVRVTLDAAPLSGAAGFAARFSATGLRAGDKLIWAFGGAQRDGNVRDRWDPIYRGNPQVCKTGDPRKPELKLGMVPQWCRDNRVLIEDRGFRLLASKAAAQAAVGRSNRRGKLRVADASASASPATLAAAGAGALPMVCGVIDLRPGSDEVFWAVQAAPATVAAKTLKIAVPADAFRSAVSYLEAVERVKTDTPDPRLDAAVAAVCHAIDASCDRNPFRFRHGCMKWSLPFLGWRVISGATALGWHDRVKGDAAYYAAIQVKDDAGRTQPQPSPGVLGCHEGAQSRFWGRGRIAPQPGHMYNTQSQFFDQIIRDWRATADPELEEILRPALELHLQWAKDCFDPDDDGLYESYINTLPTDSVWYNGGGSVEESAYAYYGHLAARDLARRAGDAEGAARHQARSEKIKRALHQALWLKDRGHFGLYVEQGGHRRAHADAWLYSEFLPIDAEMTTPEEAVQALYYTEWGLERIRLPFGGVLCQPSNWVPSKWSARDMFAGDAWHLALGYFRTGLHDEGWELLRGAMLESAYAGAVPGGFSQIGAGTDFADNSHMFARAVVEGLFGYAPDYPNGLVRVRPALPSTWPKASIRTPDFAFDYRQEGSDDRYRVALTHAAEVDFRLPVRSEKVRRVVLDGREVPWQAEPGFGCTWVRLRNALLEPAELSVETTGRLPQGAAVAIEGNVGDEVRLTPPRGRIEGWRDFHGVLENAQRDGKAIRGRLAGKPGHHLVLAEVAVGKLPQWQVFKLHVCDPQGEAKLAAKTPREAPPQAVWECLDLAKRYNGDVRTIFRQRYLSPRPRTCSVRLGTDGYSAWTFPYWNEHAPSIDLSNLQPLTDRRGRIVTSQGVPFTRFAEDRNIAFTSLWDNWPRGVTVPVNREGEAVWLLVCGSTFPVQTRIANAVVRFRYADGQVENLDLVPPLNFWSLCPWGGVDYNYRTDAFCLPKAPPPTVQLGNNCRAMVLSWVLRPGQRLDDVTLETLSPDVVVGLMGVSLMNPRRVGTGGRR